MQKNSCEIGETIINEYMLCKCCADIKKKTVTIWFIATVLIFSGE